MALFQTASLTPHGFCLAWDPALLGLHVASDTIIAAAYFSIPVALAVLMVRRRDLAFPWMFALFATFITACGTTHLMDIWTLWYPDYVLQGLIKAVTAVASIATAVALWPMLPRVLALPSPSMLREANDKLESQLRERDALLTALRQETADRERAEEMLRQAQKMEAIGQLTGGVAHDFNNLLQVVQSNLELLQRRLPDEAPVQTLVQRALHAADRGASVTQQLLAFSRRQSLRPSVFDADTLIAGLEPILSGTLPGALTLDLVLDGDLPPIEADAHQLENALLNLVINARDATPQGGRLWVETRATVARGGMGGDIPADLAPGGYVCIAVGDTGTGMSVEVQRAAFEPFFTTKPVGQGSGLGLSQVYGFVKQSHGHVVLSSEPGAGTVVSLFLPAASQAKADQQQSALNAAADDDDEGPAMRGQPVRNGLLSRSAPIVEAGPWPQMNVT